VNFPNETYQELAYRASAEDVYAHIPTARSYFSLAYSDFAAMKMGMSESASFHSVKKS
jgi:hypothetical protein